MTLDETDKKLLNTLFLLNSLRFSPDPPDLFKTSAKYSPGESFRMPTNVPGFACNVSSTTFTEIDEVRAPTSNAFIITPIKHHVTAKTRPRADEG